MLFSCSLAFALTAIPCRASAVVPDSATDDSTKTGQSSLISTGYGLVSPEDIPNSVTVYKKDFNKGLITNPLELVNGKLDGLLFYSADGNPGSDYEIRTERNKTLFTNNEPLIVIDGLPLYSAPLIINPDDIESITYIRDGASAGYYGGQAASGVILINTIKESGKTEVTYSLKAGVSTVQNKCDVMSGDEFRDLMADYLQSTPEALSSLGNANTNWQDEIYRISLGMTHYLKVTGSAAKIPFAFSYSRKDLNGIVKNSSFSGNSASLYVTPSFFDDHLKIRFKLNAKTSGRSLADENALEYAVTYDPTQSTDYIPEYGSFQPQNPLNMITYLKNTEKYSAYSGMLNLEYDFHFLPGLSLNLNSGVISKYSHNQTGYDTIAWSDFSEDYWIAEKTDHKYQKEIVESYLSWSKQLYNSQIKTGINAGISFVRATNELYDTTNTYILTDIINSWTYSYSPASQLSVFGNAFISIKDRYSLTASLRKDKYSFYSSENNAILFPSASFTWNAGNEPFLSALNIFSDLRISFSGGVSGNRYLSIPYSNDTDPQIQQEKIYNTNVSVNGFLIRNRIGFSVDAYQNLGKDLFNALIIPQGSSYNHTLLTNGASVQNIGMDFSIDLIPVRSETLTWKFRYSCSFVKNKILSLGDNIDPDYIQYNLYRIYIQPLQVNQAGYSPNSYLVYKQVYNTDGSPVEGLYVDADQDGNADYYNYDRISPRSLMSISTSLQYKDWEIAFSGRAQLGYSVFNDWYAYSSYQHSFFSSYFYNLPADFPEYNFVSNQSNSDYFFSNASFFRMDYISISRAFNHFSNTGFSFDLSVIAQNPFIITRFNGQNPEVPDGISDIGYPAARTFVIQADFHF